jgi:large subunit ribosomal protein L22
MEATAHAKSIKISPRKVRLVADSIRNLSVDHALRVLEFAQKRAAYPLQKTLLSAVANAVNNGKADREKLKIAEIYIEQGPAMKRFRPSTRGRVHPYKKKTSHIRIKVEEVTK